MAIPLLLPGADYNLLISNSAADGPDRAGPKGMVPLRFKGKTT
jgi:hypothetical protein